MALRFRGEWTHKVDAKGRVSVPAPFRRVLEGVAGWAEGAPVSMVAVKNQDRRACLNCYTLDEMASIDDDVAALPRFSKERDVLSALLAAGSDNVTLDDNGRFGITPEMREKTGITDQAVFVGMTDSFQIWSPEGYAAHKANMLEWLQAPDAPDDLFVLMRAAQEKYAQ